MEKVEKKTIWESFVWVQIKGMKDIYMYLDKDESTKNLIGKLTKNAKREF